MRAHEWTRARQRPVRQIGSLGKVAEEAAPEEPVPTPALLSEGAPSDVELVPVVERVTSPPLGVVPLAEAEADEDAATELDKGFAEPEPEEFLASEEAVPLVFEEPEPVLVSPPPTPRPPTPRRRKRPPARQAQLPLQLEPESPQGLAGRSATETREDLIQRLLDPHLSLQETAKLLNVCPTTVRRYTNRGLLAHYRTPGNQRRFRLSDVLAFMERQGIPAHGLERRRSSLTGGPEEEGEEL